MKPTLVLLSALLVARLAAAAPTPISGVVRDGSNGNRPLANQTVQLIVPGEGAARKVLGTTTTDALGKFTFAAQEWGADALLMANVPHQGYDYFAVAYDGGNKLQKVGMTVNPSKVDVLLYDTTDKPVPLQFQVHHLAINSTDTGLHVIERIVVINPSNKTFLGIGPRRTSVLLNIPKGAKNVALDPKIADAKMFQTSSGWGIEKPITPQAYGARNALIFSYDMDWPSKLPWAKKIDLSREISYPTQFFFVARLPDDKNIEVEAPLLGASSSTEIPVGDKTEERVVNSIGSPQMLGMPGAKETGPVLPANKMMPVVISRPVNPLFWAFAALTGGLVVFLPLAMVKPRRAKSAEPKVGGRVKLPTSAPGTPVALGASANGNGHHNGNGTNGSVAGADLTPSPQARELIAQIARLDDEHEAGRVEDAAYRSQRAAWKEQLLQQLNLN